jgi:hypothetical protein
MVCIFEHKGDIPVRSRMPGNRLKSCQEDRDARIDSGCKPAWKHDDNGQSVAGSDFIQQDMSN